MKGSAELRELPDVDLLSVDDFAIEAMDSTGSVDIHKTLIERYRAGSMITLPAKVQTNG